MQKLIVFSLIILSPYIFSQNGAAWVEQNSGVTSKLNCVFNMDFIGNNGWICGDNGIVLKTVNGGVLWESAGGNIPGNIQLKTISVSASTILTAGNIGNNTFIYRSTDGGSSWQIVFSQNGGKINSIVSTGNNSSFFYNVGNPVGGRWSIWKSTDWGVTWDSTGMYLPQNGNETGFSNSICLRIFSSYTQIWFGTNNSRIYYSSNGGQAWQMESVPEQNTYCVSINGISSPSQSYTEGFSGGMNLIRTTDAGNLWNNVSSLGSGPIYSLTNCELIIIPIPGQTDNYNFIRTWYIRNNKIYFSGDNGSSWSDEFTTSNGNYTHMSDGYFSHVLWAVTENGGISKGTINLTPVEPPDTYPYSFKLMQNYPNPFNASTKIVIQLHKDSHLQLNVYNSAGKLVSRLLDEMVSIPPVWVKQNSMIEYGYPTFEYTWDGTNQPSGVYYYQLIADDYKSTKKMILVK